MRILVSNFVTKGITIPWWYFSIDKIANLQEVSSTLSLVLPQLSFSHGYRLIG